MKIKSYYSRTVEDAMASARGELGPEAMLVNTRKTPPETRHLGDYEVVFATLAPDDDVAESANPHTSAVPPTAIYPDRLSVEVSELKRELEGMRRALTRSAYAPAQWAGMPQDVSDAYAALTAAEVAPDLAREIVQAAAVGQPVRPATGIPDVPPQNAHPVMALSRSHGAAFQRALKQEIENRFTTDASLGTSPSAPRIVALVGPPGSGKTTTLVKLAVNYGLAARRGVVLLSMDTQRVAAADQLRVYAGILGVGFHVLETVGALAQIIEESRGKELIFIDTPGLANAEVTGEAGLAHFLSTRTDIDTHLVLPVSMKPVDLSRVVDAFAVLKPRHLLFTRLDETSSCGPIFNEAARTAKPLSFFATGQRIPEDLEAVSRERLLDLILAGHGASARSAA